MTVVRAFGYKIEWDAELRVYDLVHKGTNTLVLSFGVASHKNKRAAKIAAFHALVAKASEVPS